MGVVRDGFLLGEMKRVAALDGSIPERFDFAFIASSSDRRCVSLLGARPKAKHCVMLSFTNKVSEGLTENHEGQILRYYEDNGSEIDLVSGDALDLETMWVKVWSAVRQCYSVKQKPLRVLLDLTTCPRFYSLGTLAGLLREGMASCITVFYSEGSYGDSTLPLYRDYPFTVGHWRAVPIPFLEGIGDPGKKSHFVVSVGFEGTRTARVLAKEDPDRVSILFPRPGVKKQYAREAENRNKRLIVDYCIPQREIVNARAGDAIEAWDKLTRASLEKEATEEVAYLCCGTKPHSLAMALRAICIQHPTVLYNLPEEHSFVDVYPTGVYRRFDITDLSAPFPGGASEAIS
jgi:hypothetical protein